MSKNRFDGKPLTLSDDEWRKRLTSEQFNVLRKAGTESAFSNAYYDHHAEGTYTCAGCGLPLYGSDAKYDSGTGWPSFTQPIHPDNVSYQVDHHLGYARTEVLCSRCKGHLGHVFDDGPLPTGKRFCMNSTSLRFVPGSPE